MNQNPQRATIDGNSRVMFFPINEENLGVCTNYNKCMEISKPDQIHNDDISQFSFPDSILKQEVPIQIQITPISPYQNDGALVDKIIQNNINERKRQKLRQMREEQQKQKERKQKLKQLKEECQNIMNKCPKKTFSLEKKNQWNHTIFGEKKQSEQKKSHSKQALPKKTSPKKEKKVTLKEVQVRIEQYKQNYKNKLENDRKAQACQHNHAHPDKNIDEKKAQIEKRAEQLTRRMKEEKRQKEEDIKTIKAKIKAIEIQSRESLKKFKKKPVDPTIEFVVDIAPTNQQKKKANKQKKESNSAKVEELMKKQEQARNTNSQRIKKAAMMNKDKKRKTKRKNSENQSELKEKSSIDPSQKPQRPYESKFYFWDMPIYDDDVKKISLQLDKNEWETQPIRQKKSFRTEVQEYLEQKIRNKMNEQNKQAKMRKMEELIMQKKKVFLEQFERTQSLKDSSSEVFWNEDEVFKFQPISNFKN